MSPAEAEVIRILAGSTGIALVVDDEGRLHQIGFGSDAATTEATFPPVLYPLAYPTFGEEPLREPALRVTHADGATSTRLVVGSVEREVVDGGELVRIRCADRVAPLTVDLVYRTRPLHHVLEQWVEVANEAEAPVTVHELAASSPAFAMADPFLTHWGGGWAGEWRETTEPLSAGLKTVRSAGGVRSSLYLPPIVLIAPDGRATETTGRVGACTLCWGGDTAFTAEVALHRQGRVIAGTAARGAERVLEPGERLSSPIAAWTWSDQGIGPTSRALHGYVRSEIVRDGDRTRALVANTWEAMGFALSPEKLIEQIDLAADLGAELFLLDDGWFGTEHPRDDDTLGLGDWSTDLRKLPQGLGPIIDHTIARGMRFGLWVEPEMVNPRSVLYEQHPDWVIAESGRDRREERQQLVLDLCRPEVRAFCVDLIDRLLAEHPGITYLKWDANRDITEPGSAVLPPDRQTHLADDRVEATWLVMAEVARRHPGVELMLCASGGGRSDLGTLRYFHELWTSDNTDPVDRVRIQWGASHLLPPLVQGAHVTRWGQKPFGFACAVALGGRFGFDLDLTSLTAEEQALARDAVRANARLAPIVQHGDVHRLVSPVTGTRAAIAHLATDGSAAAVFAHRLPDDPSAEGRIALPMLPEGTWTVEDLTPGSGGGSTTADAEALRSNGLEWPDGPPPSSRVYLLTRT